MAWGRSLECAGAASPRSGAGRAPRAAGTKRLETGAAQLILFCGPSGPETARTGSSRVYGVRGVILGPAGARFHFSRIERKIFRRRSEPAPTPCAGGACRLLGLNACACPAPPPAMRRGRETIPATYYAPGGGHCGSALLGPPAAALRPEQDGRASSKFLTAVWHPILPRRADRK